MTRLTMLKPRVATLDTSLAPAPPKQTEQHYGTPEHKAWAAEVIKRANGRCQDAQHKGRHGRLVADHIVERRDGGDPLALTNGRALCWSCHTRKTNAERALRHRGERRQV
jgi:5-methylcytosine-specific restriction protein A